MYFRVMYTLGLMSLALVFVLEVVLRRTFLVLGRVSLLVDLAGFPPKDADLGSVLGRGPSMCGWFPFRVELPFVSLRDSGSTLLRSWTVWTICKEFFSNSVIDFLLVSSKLCNCSSLFLLLSISSKVFFNRPTVFSTILRTDFFLQ